MIQNNNLEKPYTIYPNQKLSLSSEPAKKSVIYSAIKLNWHHPLGERFKQQLPKMNLWLIFKNPKATPIYSIQSGKVVVSGPDIPGYGNLVMISHPDGYLSLYAHCEKIFVETRR